MSGDTLNILRSEEWYSNSMVGSSGVNGGNVDENVWLVSVLEQPTYKKREKNEENRINSRLHLIKTNLIFMKMNT